MPKSIISLINPLNISLLFVALMVLLPFISVIHNLPIPSFYSEWIAGMLGLLAIGALLISKSLSRIKIPLISVIFLGLSALVIVQWLTGLLHSAQLTLLIISYLIFAFLLAILGSHLRNELGLEKLAITLAFTLLIAGFINIGIVTLQIVMRTGGTITFLPFLTSYGSLSQSNHFASFCTLAIISAIYLFLKRKFSLGFLMLILASFLTMLAFSGSRSAFLYLATLLILAFISQVLIKKQNNDFKEAKDLLPICLLTLPLFSLVILFITYAIPDEIVNLPTERFIASASTNSPRLSIWIDSLNLFFNSPWLGIGVGNMRIESFLMQDSPTKFTSTAIHENAHNLFLHLLTETGVGGFLIVLTGLTVWLRVFKWREFNLESWWLITLLAVLGMHSMLEYPLWYAYFLSIAAILLGAGDEKILYAFNSNIHYNFKYIIVIRSVLVILLLTGAVNLCTMLLANSKLESAIYQSKNLKFEDHQEDLQWILNYSLLAPYAEVILAMSTEIDNHNLDSIIKLNESAIRFRPISKLAYQRVILLSLKGHNDEALNLLNRCLYIYPTNIEYIIDELPSEYKKHFLQLIAKINQK